jgi:hypothetical protein
MERLLATMLLMSLMTVSCNKSGDGSSTESPSSQTPIGEDLTSPSVPVSQPSPVTVIPTSPEEPVPIVTPVTPLPVSTLPQRALTFGTNVLYLSGFDGADEIKYDKAVALVKKVVATEAFRSAVLNHTYEGVKQFVQNNGLTNEQVYQSILDAAEKLTPAKNNILDVGVKLYYENSSTVGYTSTGVTYINVNTKYFDTYAVNSVASNLFHEWLHKVGYGHDVAATARRPYSVPYAIGYMIRDIGKKFL